MITIIEDRSTPDQDHDQKVADHVVGVILVRDLAPGHDLVREIVHETGQNPIQDRKVVARSPAHILKGNLKQSLFQLYANLAHLIAGRHDHVANLAVNPGIHGHESLRVQIVQNAD